MSVVDKCTHICIYVGIKDQKEKDQENDSHKFLMLGCIVDDLFFFKGVYI